MLGANSNKKQLPFVRNVFRAIQVDYGNTKYNICSLASSTPRPLFPFKTGFYRKKTVSVELKRIMDLCFTVVEIGI